MIPSKTWVAGRSPATAVRSARSEIEILADASPILRRTLDDAIARQLPRVRAAAAEAMTEYGEIPRVPLEQLHYDVVAVLGERRTQG